MSTMTSRKPQAAAGVPYFTPANNAGVPIASQDEGKPVPTVFQPIKIRDVTLRNRFVVSPMCMYSCEGDPSSPAVGAMNDYHLVHLGHLALKGAGLIIVEATAVTPNGRISPWDVGLWGDENSEQFKGLKRVVEFAHSQGAKVAVQLAHAGRKASTLAPYVAAHFGVRSLRAEKEDFGWPEDVVAPSGGEKFTWETVDESEPRKPYHPPRELTREEIADLVRAFAKAARTAVRAGVDVIEVHGAHGYLITEFLSPVTNRRTDEYGGSFENRTRFLREVLTAVRAELPEGMPLFLRVSSTEWLEGTDAEKEAGSSWTVEDTIRLAKELPSLGVDLLDVSSGGNHPQQRIDPFGNYQIDIAARVRKELRAAGINNLFIGAVGGITTASQARDIVEGANIKEEAAAAEAAVSGPEPKADVILVARQFLRDSAWVLNVAKELGVKVAPPHQYGRA